MNEIHFIEVPRDQWNYPTWEWPDTATQLLFDIGFSYGMLHQTEIMLKGLSQALVPYVDRNPSNQALKERLDELLGQMENFRAKRLNARDQVYNAGYLAAAKLDQAKYEP